MKKIGKLFAVLLTAAMLLSLLSVMAAAASSPTFRVYCELDKTSYAVNDTVTAKIYVQRTDASDDYALYNFTDRVVFYTVLLAYESGETGPADFRLDSGSNGNGTYWNERCSYISIRYQYLASGTPDNRAATLLAATLRFKVKANCQTTLGHDHVQVWTTPSGTAGETAASESATITAGTPKYCSLTFSGGSGATGSAAGMSRIPSGSYVTLPSNSFAKTGKTFGGWYDGKSICPAGTNYYVTSDTAFTAVWKPAVITYSGGSGGDVLCVNPSNTRVLTGDTAEVGTVLTFTATAANGYKFAGWSDGSSENPRTVTVIGDVNLTARFTASGGTGNTVNTGDNGNTGSTGASGSVPVVVDGTEYGIGSSAVSGGTTVVTVDQTALENQLQTASSTVVVPISADTSAVEAKLVVENIETMADKNMTLSVQTGNVTYEVPAAAVDTAELMKALNAADPAAVPVTVTIQQLDSSNVTVSGGTLLMAPVSFTVTASYGGQTYTVSTFTKYVARVITVPSGVDATKITTAVVAENGTERHVPTDVYYENGVWYARINSLTNSVYALIYNQASFTDAKNAWYRDVVTEMASRKIISGVGGGRFEGSRSITRAEFASIIVRALGLPTDGSAAYSDVSSSAWYSGAVGTAARYGIVNGYSNGTFRPNKKITRQEAMAMISRAAKVTGWAGSSGSLSGFSDAGTVGAWARSAVEWNVGSGIIVGTQGKLRLNENITRAQTATVVLRLLQKAGLIDIRTNT